MKILNLDNRPKVRPICGFCTKYSDTDCNCNQATKESEQQLELKDKQPRRHNANNKD